jgi:hypothetical protein
LPSEVVLLIIIEPFVFHTVRSAESAWALARERASGLFSLTFYEHRGINVSPEKSSKGLEIGVDEKKPDFHDE